MKKIFPHIFVAFAFIILFAMGTWQVQRLQYKEALIEKINTRMAKPPITNITSLEQDEFRIITLTGTFDYAHQMVLLGKPLNGKPGQHIITPLKTPTGEVILVNRGWTPYDEANYEKPEGPIVVSAIIRSQPKPNAIGRMIFQKNNPSKDLWFQVDLSQMYAKAGAPVKDYYVENIAEEQEKRYPYALPKEIKLYNEHLTYAITWYTLSIALLLVYYFRFYGVKNGNKRATK